MASMEVLEAVIVEEHDDGYPKEAADRRHSLIMPTASAVLVQTKPFASKGLEHLGRADRKTVGIRDMRVIQMPLLTFSGAMLILSPRFLLLTSMAEP